MSRFYANIVHLLETHLTRSGYEMTLLHARRDVKDLLKATQTSLADGVIVIGGAHLAEGFLRVLAKSKQPCVLIDTFRPDFVDHITLDLRPAVEEALHLMVSTGRKRIAYVANNRDEAAYTEVRMATYLRVMEAAGHAPEIIDVDTQALPDERIAAAAGYLDAHGCPDALLCQNDETAIYTYRAVVNRGFRLPDDVLLVGCDGLPYMEFFDPPLSTIALPTEAICKQATQFLQQRISDPALAVQEAVLPGRLLVRKSLQAS